MNDIDAQCRRRFLAFLAGSPLLAAFRAATASGQEPIAGASPPGPIASPDDALNVFDFELVAREALPPAHWGYLATGVVGDATLRANRDAFSKLYMRPRRLVDVTRIDTSVELFGTRWETPIGLAPAGSQRAFHEQGELAVARAARNKRYMPILSTVTTISLEEVVEAYGGPIWYQLYPTSHWEVTRGLLKRAEAVGCPVAMVTVDQVTGRNRETLRRYIARDRRNCLECHTGGRQAYIRKRPMFEGLVTDALRTNLAPDLTWEFLPRLRDATAMKILIKGIVTREDAQRCLEHGVDGIVVSNHGGRGEESGRGTLDSLPEVLEAVAGEVPVLIDGGFRRGMDVFKALALGASAVCIGRPYLWGLAAFGQDGVEKVLDLLRLEFELAMKTSGTRSLSEIDRSCIGVA